MTEPGNVEIGGVIVEALAPMDGARVVIDRLDAGTVRLSVRGADGRGSADMYLSDEEARELADELARVVRDPPAQKPP